MVLVSTRHMGFLYGPLTDEGDELEHHYPPLPGVAHASSSANLGAVSAADVLQSRDACEAGITSGGTVNRTDPMRDLSWG